MSEEHSPEEPPEEPRAGLPLSAEALRARLAADIAAGKTAALSAAEMADPELRRQLPALLADLAGTTPDQAPLFQVPGYTVLGAIGHGGMSTVYLARQNTLGRYVALKVAPWGIGDTKLRDRLRQEALAMARVAHPNIVAIHDIVDIGDTVAIAMEWVDGQTLEALLRAMPEEPSPGDMDAVRTSLGTPPGATGSFEVSAVRFFVRVLLGVARAVHRVHQAGLLHLDIKPSNVLLRRDGTPLLADFGVVREMQAELARTRSFAGTPLYCAPEQLRRDDRGFGSHTDVYGLGITLYEVLSRHQPLRGHDLTKLVHAVEGGRIPALGTRIAIAKDLETIVQKAMAPEPRHRYASAAAFADDLEAFLEGRPVVARPLPRLQRMQRWAKNEPWKAALLAVLLVTLPIVALLGIELLVGMPHIEEGRRRDLRNQANALKQTAYLRQFAGQIGTAEAAELLKTAMQLDPGQSSLACLASMLVADDYDEATNLLAQHADQLATCTGLQLIDKKAHEHRQFFVPAEVDVLASSAAPIDWYVLALDRVLWAEDARNEEAFERAAFHLGVAETAGEPDPLTMGLRAWVASRAGLAELRDATCRAMRSRWPDNAEVMAWDCLIREMDGAEAATSPAELWLAHHPDCVLAWELAIGCALRQKRWQAGLELVERARAVPVSSPDLDYYHVVLLLSTKSEQAQGMCENLAGRPLSIAKQLRLEMLESPKQAKDLCDTFLRRAKLSPHDLERIYSIASQLEDRDLCERTFARWQHENPDLRSLFCFEMQARYGRRDVIGAADLARQIKTPNQRIQHDGGILCSMFATAHYWLELEQCAHRWQQFGPAEQQPQAAAYAGLAAARLGDLPAAARLLAAATIAQGRPSTWYASALLELAWLRVAPSTLPSLRDPEAAKALVTRFETVTRGMSKPPRGAWVEAVRAETYFANGDKARAIAAAKAGLNTTDHDYMVAPDDCAAILQAALERYGR